VPTFNSYAKLRGLSTEQLVELYDQRAQHADVGVAFVREEIARREAEKQTAAIAEMTATMRNLTWVITALTAVNVIVAAVPLFR
jgi:hypothetical protein